MDSLYFALIYKWLQSRISHFGIDTASHLTGLITSSALVIVTIWVFMRGFRIVTGASHEPMTVLVTHMVKVSLIVVLAQTVSTTGSQAFVFLNTTLPQQTNYIITGSTGSATDKIDQNLLLVSAATSAIDMVQVPTGDTALAEQKAHTTLIATLGIAAPAMTAGAMLLLYQIAMAMLVGLAPLFILCLMFDQTKDLCRRWFMYLVGTLFSMAMLNLVISWTLDLTSAVAGALWTTDALSSITGLDAQGFNTQAFQQGGVGLLMTVLIISTPPMTAMLFNGTLGGFMTSSGLTGAATGRSNSPPGGYQGHGGVGGSSQPVADRPSQTQQSGTGRFTGGVSLSQDVVKTQPDSGGSR